METKKKRSLASLIPPKVWLRISFVAAKVVWTILSIISQTARGFPNVVVTIEGLITLIAAEFTGAEAGLGMQIRTLADLYDSADWTPRPSPNCKASCWRPGNGTVRLASSSPTTWMRPTSWPNG